MVNSWTLPLASTESNRVEDSLLPLIPHAEPRAAGLAHSKKYQQTALDHNKLVMLCAGAMKVASVLCWTGQHKFVFVLCWIPSTCFALDDTTRLMFCAGSQKMCCVLCWITKSVLCCVLDHKTRVMFCAGPHQTTKSFVLSPKTPALFCAERGRPPSQIELLRVLCEMAASLSFSRGLCPKLHCRTQKI